MFFIIQWIAKMVYGEEAVERARNYKPKRSRRRR
jgi:hypothetical protein